MQQRALKKCSLCLSSVEYAASRCLGDYMLHLIASMHLFPKPCRHAHVCAVGLVSLLHEPLDSLERAVQLSISACTSNKHVVSWNVRSIALLGFFYRRRASYRYLPGGQHNTGCALKADSRSAMPHASKQGRLLASEAQGRTKEPLGSGAQAPCVMLSRVDGVEDGILEKNIPRVGGAQRSVPLRDIGGHPDAVTSLRAGACRGGLGTALVRSLSLDACASC
jgi:hypothetical protein